MLEEPQCTVKLMHHTPLYIGAHGARTCWDSGDKSDTTIGLVSGKIVCGKKDAELLDRVGNKFKHASILEHLSYNFFITDVSRALLQELARHRMASYSVKSTRYTLKELKEEEPFILSSNDMKLNVLRTTSLYQLELGKRASKYLVYTGEEIVDKFSIDALENLRQALALGISNDKAKYALPESYKTELTWSINARSLQNFLSLRSDKSALWEIRQLAKVVYDALPEDHKYLFKDYLKSGSDE